MCVYVLAAATGSGSGGGSVGWGLLNAGGDGDDILDNGVAIMLDRFDDDADWLDGDSDMDALFMSAVS